ncbi:apolipoprotein N-acyltransferase [Magnetovibrio sp. PR-2]|uniref:apolipoprotein N-acyltransferase n=1 Tax=Magnetovibrio sp. PR-2 TaxID=3120356 RepID=UPI002FCDFBA0
MSQKLYAWRVRLQTLGIWPQRFIALVLGFGAVFAMPPVYQIYVLVPAFVGLLWLSADAPSPWRAFAIGWWFGAGYFGAGLYWVSFALLVDAQKFAWLMPIAILGFAFGLGLFVALGSVLVRRLPGDLTAKALVMASGWTLLEWLRGWILTGLPWNPLGSVWAFHDAPLQATWVVGVYGLSLITALAAVSVGTLAEEQPNRLSKPLVLLAGGLLMVVWIGGAVRLSGAPDASVEGVRLRLVQPNIPQAEKWRAELRTRNMRAQLDLALAEPLAGQPHPTHIIWAETAAPFFIENSPDWLKVVGAATPPEGLTILGAPRVLPDGQPNGVFKVTNSLLAINGEGQVHATYDKFHLVPFGEYVPLPSWLPLEKITQGVGAFTPGTGPVSLRLPGLPPVSPLICYEIIFPHAVADYADRPSWLLNLTNDAWYGMTAGPHQHFVSARLRAVEEGLPTVRVAFTGISGIVDGYGRVQEMHALGEKGFVDGNLPLAVEGRGLYTRFGNAVAVVVSLLCFGLGLVVGRKAQTS